MQKPTDLPWQVLPPDYHEINTLYVPPRIIALVPESNDAKYIVQAVNAYEKLRKALKAASDHLDYCGYGDPWERECAQEQGLEKQIREALDATHL